jgi:hypothetical protein
MDSDMAFRQGTLQGFEGYGAVEAAALKAAAAASAPSPNTSSS